MKEKKEKINEDTLGKLIESVFGGISKLYKKRIMKNRRKKNLMTGK